eukprot:IDg8499t1
MVLTLSKKKEIFELIQSRIEFIDEDDNIVQDAYASLVEVLEFRSGNATDYAVAIAEAFPPDMLFHSSIIASEGRVFYSIIRDLLRIAGLDSPSSRNVPLPIQVAKLLYTSPEDTELSYDERNAENSVLEAAKKLYNESSFPIAPRRHLFHFPSRGIKSETGNGINNKNAVNENGSVNNEYGSIVDVAAADNARNEVNYEEEHDTIAPNHGPAAQRTQSDERHYQVMMRAARTLQRNRSASNNSRRGAAQSQVQNEQPVHQIAAECHATHNAFESKKKSGFVNTLMKKFMKESDLFNGTDNKSWISHLQIYEAIAKAHDINSDDIMLNLAQWELMLTTYNSEVVHSRTRDAILSVSLVEEIAKSDDGPQNTKFSRAVTRTANQILRFAKDLPSNERTDRHLLQYFRMAIKGVEFTKVAQLSSLQEKHATFDSLSLQVLTAAQVEDSYGKKSGMNQILFTEPEPEPENERQDVLESFFVDRRFGRTNKRRSKKCGDNKRRNREWKGKIMTCHDCNSKFHLKFQRQCKGEIARRNRGGSILDDVRKQLNSGKSTEELLVCLAIALEDETIHDIGDRNNTDSDSKIENDNEEIPDADSIPIRFAESASNKRIEESKTDSDEELFNSLFLSSLEHNLKGRFEQNLDFQDGTAM